MRRTAVAAVALLLAGCGGRAGAAQHLHGTWRLATVAGRAVQAGASIEFGAAHRVSGDDGCNLFAGTFALRGRVVSLRAIATTERACLLPSVPSEAMDALLRAGRDIAFSATGAALTMRPPGGPTFGFRR